MATAISSIQYGKRKDPRRIGLYGLPGVGKSTFAAMAPNPIFISTEDGLADIDCASFPEVKKYQDVIDYISALYKDDHDFQTVVIDSADWLDSIIQQQVAADKRVPSIDDIDFFKGYLYAVDYWREIMQGLDALRAHRGMHCILIAHARIKQFQDPETDAYDRYEPNLDKRAWAAVSAWLTEILFARYKTHTKESGEGFKKRSQGIGTGERVLRTADRPAHEAKNRLQLPFEMPLDWREFAKYLDGNQPTEEKENEEDGTDTF